MRFFSPFFEWKRKTKMRSLGMLVLEWHTARPDTLFTKHACKPCVCQRVSHEWSSLTQGRYNSPRHTSAEKYLAHATRFIGYLAKAIFWLLSFFFYSSPLFKKINKSKKKWPFPSRRAWNEWSRRVHPRRVIWTRFNCHRFLLLLSQPFLKNNQTMANYESTERKFPKWLSFHSSPPPARPPKEKKMFKYLFNKAADDDGKWRRSRGISIKMGCVSYAHDVKSPLLFFFYPISIFFFILRLQVCCSHLIQRLVNPLSLPPSHFGYVILMMNDDGPEKKKKRGMLRMRRWENTRPPPPLHSIGAFISLPPTL